MEVCASRSKVAASFSNNKVRLAVCKTMKKSDQLRSTNYPGTMNENGAKCSVELPQRASDESDRADTLSHNDPSDNSDGDGPNCQAITPKT